MPRNARRRSPPREHFDDDAALEAQIKLEEDAAAAEWVELENIDKAAIDLEEDALAKHFWEICTKDEKFFLLFLNDSFPDEFFNERWVSIGYKLRSMLKLEEAVVRGIA